MRFWLHGAVLYTALTVDIRIRCPLESKWLSVDRLRHEPGWLMQRDECRDSSHWTRVAGESPRDVITSPWRHRYAIVWLFESWITVAWHRSSPTDISDSKQFGLKTLRFGLSRVSGGLDRNISKSVTMRYHRTHSVFFEHHFVILLRYTFFSRQHIAWQ